MFDNATTRRLAVMNLALRGIEVDFGPEHADTFRRDRRLNFELRTSNFELGNGPPFKDSDWFRKDDDVRFSSLSASNGERAGVRCRNDLPPKGNANFAHGSMSSNQPGEGDIRRALIEADWEISRDEMERRTAFSRLRHSKLILRTSPPSPASSSTARRSPSASGSLRKMETRLLNTRHSKWLRLKTTPLWPRHIQTSN